EILPAGLRSGPLHWFARDDVPVRIALQRFVARQRETGARGHHNRYHRPPRDNRRQVAAPCPAAPGGEPLPESGEQELNRVDRRDGHEAPPSTHQRPGRPPPPRAAELSRGVSPVFRTTLPA